MVKKTLAFATSAMILTACNENQEKLEDSQVVSFHNRSNK